MNFSLSGNLFKGIGIATIGALVLSPDTLFMRWSEMDAWSMLTWRGFEMGLMLILFSSCFGIYRKNFNKDITSWFVNLGFMYNGSTPRLYPTQVEIYLLDTDQKNLGEPLEKWSLYHCYPTSVTMGEFNSTKSDIAIETITLSYSRYIRTVF